MNRPNALSLPDRQLPVSRRPSARRVVIAVLSATAVALSLVGCSAPEKPPKPIVTTCGEFLALSDPDQAYAYKGLKWQYYSATSAGKVKQNEIFAEACQTLPPETFLDDVLNSADSADCDLFATLGPDMQAKWLEAVAAMVSYQGPELTAEALLAACAGFQEKDAEQATLLLEDYPTYGTWTSTTTLGYTETMTLAIGRLVSGEKAANPSVSDFNAGDACGYDPAKDAAIPFIVRITNTTPIGPAKPSAAFNLHSDDGVDLSTTAAVEGVYGGAASCVTNPIGLFGTEPIESGDNLTGYYFAILKNFFSPLNPQGAYGELASYRFESTRPLNLEDGIADITTLTLSLEAAGK